MVKADLLQYLLALAYYYHYLNERTICPHDQFLSLLKRGFDVNNYLGTLDSNKEMHPNIHNETE